MTTLKTAVWQTSVSLALHQVVSLLINCRSTQPCVPPYHPANRVLERSKVKPFNSLKPELNYGLVKLFVVKLVYQVLISVY